VTNETAISVSELNLMVAEAIRRDPRTRSVIVRGEISGFRNHIATGHWYFSLKDSDAAVSCVMFRTNTLKAKLRPKDGDLVLAEGYVDVYPAQGKYQLYVTGLRSAGQGEEYIRLEMLKRRLAAEGLFDPGRKRPLPLVPKKVAVVTSQSGAALHDILNVSGMRCPFVPIVLIPVPVQGNGAGKGIAEGIRRADEETDADVIIVARGGGSAEDLWCFNDEAVARAVAGSRKPVVSGVGHEVDITLCDLAADVRASTPSNAAEIVFPDTRDLFKRTALLRSGMFRAWADELRKTELQLKDTVQRLSALSPEKRISMLMNQASLSRARLSGAFQWKIESRNADTRATRTALIQAATNRIRETEHMTAKLRERLTAVNPMAVMCRGYAIVYDTDGQMITSAAQAQKREEMSLRFADGRIRVARKEET